MSSHTANNNHLATGGGGHDVLRLQEIYKELTDYINRHVLDSDMLHAFENSATAIQGFIRLELMRSRQSRALGLSGLRAQFYSHPSKPPSARDMTNFGRTWTDDRDITGPAELPEDFDAFDTDLGKTEDDTDTAVGTAYLHTGLLISNRLGNHPPVKDKAPFSSSSLTNTLSSPPPQAAARAAAAATACPPQVNQASPATPPDLERGDAHDYPPTQHDDGRAFNAGSADDCLHSQSESRIRYRYRMVVCFLVITVLITTQAYSLGQSAYIKATKPADACTDVLAHALDFLLGVLHNTAPVALLIACILRERTMHRGYFWRFVGMMVWFGLAICAATVLQVKGKYEFAMMCIGVSDILVLLATFFYFEYVLQPLDSTRLSGS